MVAYQNLSVQVIKYTICLILIFALIYIIPNNKLEVKDAFVLSLLVTLSLAVLEHIAMIFSPDSRAEKFEELAKPDTASVETPPVVEVAPTVAAPIAPVTVTPPIVESPPTVIAPVVEVAPIAPVTPVTVTPPIVESPPAVVAPIAPVAPVAPVAPAEGSKTTKEAVGSRAEDDVITNEMPYTDYHHLPLSDNYKPDMFEYGYSFLPPEKWYPQPPFPPVCVSEKRCPVCPTNTTGTPIDVKEWHSSRRITPPDNINTDYIKEKLNSGR